MKAIPLQIHQSNLYKTAAKARRELKKQMQDEIVPLLEKGKKGKKKERSK